MNLINNKLLVDNPSDNNFKPSLASHIEAVKPGEEPICFGPTATLVNYGPSWILQTVVDTRSQTTPPAKGEATTHKPRKAKVLSSFFLKQVLSFLCSFSRDFIPPFLSIYLLML